MNKGRPRLLPLNRNNDFRCHCERSEAISIWLGDIATSLQAPFVPPRNDSKEMYLPPYMNVNSLDSSNFSLQNGDELVADFHEIYPFTSKQLKFQRYLVIIRTNVLNGVWENLGKNQHSYMRFSFDIWQKFISATIGRSD
jgi:hypothetical protein